MGIDYRTTIRRMTPTDMPSMAFQDLLSDVIIEVHPTRTLDNINDDVATAPIAQIPAHAAILASQSKYFHAMFSSGMEEAVTLESRKEKTRIRFFGYSVKAIKFFLVHMYQEENARKVANSQNVLNDAKELLALANQYECTSLFDRVSYSILEVSLNHQTVVQCLALGKIPRALIMNALYDIPARIPFL
ncbi:hypothetical protein DFS34DRAFT_678485 [Phlyctochytrium arcticum]|nr:hypothetical protein DFS34DRAFT_678485 [Phlyctochytrium arcticum]